MSVIEILFEIAEGMAKQKYDGHLTVMRFTTHWKVMFGTPNLDIDGRQEVRQLKAYSSLAEALKELVCSEL